MIDPHSPLLSIPVLDTALRGATDPAVRIQILAAKVQVLECEVEPHHSHTHGAHGAHSAHQHQAQDPTALFAARLDLADAYLSTTPPDVHTASAEASVVEAECKRIQKRIDRVRVEGKVEDWMERIQPLRKRAVTLLATIDEGLGRSARAERWKKLAEEL